MDKRRHWSLLLRVSIKFSVLLLVLPTSKGIAQNDKQSAVPLLEIPSLKILQISPHTYLHISYLFVRGYGKVACNGMVVIRQGEAIVLDSPANDTAAVRLIDWIEKKMGSSIKAIVATHFHEDCLGSLPVFHDRGIPSFASEQTVAYARADSVILPQNSFLQRLVLKVGNSNVVNEFLGEGHTRDNIISYFPDDQVMFGGCLIKSVGAGKGNLADANVETWSETVQAIKRKYPDLEKVIPGHGKSGGTELLDFTISLFNKEK